MIAALVEPFAIVIETLTVPFVIVHDVEVVGVDLEAPDGHGVVDADVPRGVHTGDAGVARGIFRPAAVSASRLGLDDSLRLSAAAVLVVLASNGGKHIRWNILARLWFALYGPREASDPRSRRRCASAPLRCGLLEENGFGVVEAANADAALKLLETRDDVRLLFTDIQMPGSI
jgi:hypothetical protein